MADYTELKRLAEAATPGPWISGGNWVSTQKGVRSVAECSRGDEKYIAAANPAVVLALIAENERLAASVKLNLCDYPAIHQGDVDLLVAFVTGASQIELAKVHNCTPPNISRKIRRVKERLGWREGMLLSEIRDRAEQLRALASQGAVVTADLMAERNQLKAENAGLQTGYKAYEQVNAELRAELQKVKEDRSACWAEFKVQGRQVDQLKTELEVLRKDAERLDWLTVQGEIEQPGQGDVRGFIDTAMGQGEQP